MLGVSWAGLPSLHSICTEPQKCKSAVSVLVCILFCLPSTPFKNVKLVFCCACVLGDFVTFLCVIRRPISGTNKGHKLLQKMGWKEGESLGKDSASGIVEPVSPHTSSVVSFQFSSYLPCLAFQIHSGVRASATAGLGSSLNVTQSLDRVNDRRTKVWLKTIDRYEKLGDRDPT